MTERGNVAWVTGGGTGIGRAIALELGRRDYRVAICGRRREPLEEAAASMREEGIEVFSSTCDVSASAQVRGFVETLEDRWGPVHALVNNAGVSGVTPVGKGVYETWDRVIAVNVNALYYCTDLAVRRMRDGGRIINISSVLGKFGVPGYSAYCTSKHAVIGFTRSVALELAPRKIAVNAVCPGWVETAMARQGMERGAKERGKDYDEYRQAALRRVPLGEMIQPEEVAALVGYLVSPAAGNITGQAINICGGQVMY